MLLKLGNSFFIMTFDINGLRQNLGDHEAWLIYADILQSKGDPIGELIAIDHSLSILPRLPKEQNYYTLMGTRDNVRKILKKQLEEKGVSGILRWNHGYPEEVYFKGTHEQRVLLEKKYPLIKLIENILGDHRSFSKLVPGTRRHVDELWKDRFAVPELINHRFWTADGAIYFMRDGKPYFALTRENQNPLLNNLDESYKQIWETGNYPVSDKDLEFALADLSTEVFDLDGLSFSRYFDYYSCLELFTTNPRLDSLNEDERRLVERVYGKGDDFNKVMRMLNKRNWFISRVYVLNPSYVREHASASAIGRASWLYYYDFNADEHNVSNHIRLSGVVSSEPAGESNSDRAKKRGRLSVFKGMEGGELSVINNNIGGLTVTSEDIPEDVGFIRRIRGKFTR